MCAARRADPLGRHDAGFVALRPRVEFIAENGGGAGREVDEGDVTLRN